MNDHLQGISFWPEAYFSQPRLRCWPTDFFLRIDIRATATQYTNGAPLNHEAGHRTCGCVSYPCRTKSSTMSSSNPLPIAASWNMKHEKNGQEQVSYSRATWQSTPYTCNLHDDATWCNHQMDGNKSTKPTKTYKNNKTNILLDTWKRLWTFQPRLLSTQCRSRRSGWILRLSVAWDKGNQKYAQHRLNLAEVCQSWIASTMTCPYNMIMSLIFTLRHSATSTSALPVAGPVTYLKQYVSQVCAIFGNKDATTCSTHTVQIQLRSSTELVQLLLGRTHSAQICKVSLATTSSHLGSGPLKSTMAWRQCITRRCWETVKVSIFQVRVKCLGFGAPECWCAELPRKGEFTFTTASAVCFSGESNFIWKQI